MEFDALQALSCTGRLGEDLDLFGRVFRDDDILVVRRFTTADGAWSLALLCFDGMTDPALIDLHILRPLTAHAPGNAAPSLETVRDRLLTVDSAGLAAFADAVDHLLHGDALLLLDGDDRILYASAKGYARRGIQEPDAERSVSGPHEGFTESLVTNTALLRRKLLSPDLKLVTLQPAARSRQRLCLAYLDSLVDRRALGILRERLKKLDFDLLPDSRYVEETVGDHRLSPLRTVGSTEKPDIAAAKLLEGKICLLLDGTPTALTVPFLFMEYFQTGDDYYTGFWSGSLGRLLRVLGFFLAVTLPALYQAFITFHQEIIPVKLLLSIASARSGVPFPTFLELFIMLFAFGILREAGSMMPGSVGQALSTVGAVVIGQAAVDAKFVSAPLVIIVAATGLCDMMTPRLESATFLLRQLLLLCAGMLGLPGVVFGLSLIVCGMLAMESFGLPYLPRVGSGSLAALRDSAVHGPVWTLRFARRRAREDRP